MHAPSTTLVLVRRAVAEHVVGVDCVAVLEELGIERGRERRDGHRLLGVGELGADRAAALVEVLGGHVEDALAPAAPDARPVRGQEAAVEAPGDVAVDDLLAVVASSLAHPAIRNRLSKSSWLRYAPHIVRLPA